MSELIKHYQNTMQGIPQLSNNWGSMIALLDAVLVTGFNHVPVVGLAKSSATAITATINLGGGHGFIDRQVVRIAGSTNGWDGDYKVLSSDSTSITVECTAEHPSTVLGTATCFTAPLDFEIVHQTPISSTEPKRAYRSTDLESLGLILLVHDFCVSGAAATGAKFAKVGVVDEMSDIDTIAGNQMPYSTSNPNLNWGWDGTYHGWAKWYYRTANGIGSIADTTASTAGGTPFLIVGDSKSFTIETNQNAPYVYGFFEFYDNYLNAQNLCLLAQGLQGNQTQSSAVFNTLRGSYCLIESSFSGMGASNLNLRGVIWFDSAGVAEHVTCGPALTISQAINGRNASIANLNIAAPLPVADASNRFLGQFPFLKMSASKNNAEHTLNNIGKCVNRYASGGNGIDVKYAITLESY